MQDYEIRKHYEAALHDLSIMFGFQPRLLRGEFKSFLIQHKVIQQSTKELDNERLSSLADKLSLYYHRMENTPPDERGLLDFKNVLKLETKTKTHSINLKQNEFKVRLPHQSAPVGSGDNPPVGQGEIRPQGVWNSTLSDQR